MPKIICPHCKKEQDYIIVNTSATVGKRYIYQYDRKTNSYDYHEFGDENTYDESFESITCDNCNNVIPRELFEEPEWDFIPKSIEEQRKIIILKELTK